MWIQLTSSDGKQVSFNSLHVVALKDHGDGTLVIYRNGMDIVRESQAAIFDVLRLYQINGGEHRDKSSAPEFLA